MLHRWTSLFATAAVLAVSSGALADTAAQPLQVAASPNRPPVWEDDASTSVEQQISSDGVFSMSIRASDPDYDTLTYTLRGLPKGATVRWVLDEKHDSAGRVRASYYSPQVTWSPRSGQIGRFDFEVLATDGKLEISQTIRVTVEEEWESFLMPGATYSAWFPAGQETYGTFHGPSFELLFAGWIHRTENRGPSHVRIYLDLGLLTGTRSEQSKAVQLAFGFDLSIERNPQRRMLIPYFGLEGGWLFQTQIGKPAFFAPQVGLHLWSDRNLFVNVSGAYLFPTAKVDQLRGFTGKLGFNASLW